MSDRTTRFPRWLTWSLFAALAVLIVGYGAIFLYATVLNDSPDEFDTDDLDAVLTDTAVTDTAVTDSTVTDTAVTDSTITDTAVTDMAVTDSTDTTVTDSAWVIAEGSQVGYRVAEILFGVDTEAVGRTGDVTGTMTISGTDVTEAEFVVDVASIESDDSRRDGQFRGRIMSADEYPEASFVLTEPIGLGTGPGDGVDVVTTATGKLTLRGVTNTVTFEVTAEQRDGRVGVLGSIPVLFSDYDIANPSFGGITTEDDGLVEFVLVFEPQTG